MSQVKRVNDMINFYNKFKKGLAKGTGCNFKVMMLVVIGWLAYEVVIPFV
ncbi:hypothetical protein [Roseivirga sp. 4D4]|nr:hypothetical protein [Roseivirga sp. 4D4]